MSEHYAKLAERFADQGRDGYQIAKAIRADASCDRLYEALQQLVDYVKDGCPDDGKYYVMTEAQAALKGLAIISGGSRPQADLTKALQDILDANDNFRAGMPDDWEGDPLEDACNAAKVILAMASVSFTSGIREGK